MNYFKWGYDTRIVFERSLGTVEMWGPIKETFAVVQAGDSGGGGLGSVSGIKRS